jgi:hypothetical protein
MRVSVDQERQGGRDWRVYRLLDKMAKLVMMKLACRGGDVLNSKCGSTCTAISIRPQIG